MALILVFANSQKLFSYGLLKFDSGLLKYVNLWTKAIDSGGSSFFSFLKRYPEYTKNTKNTKDFCPSKGVKN